MSPATVEGGPVAKRLRKPRNKFKPADKEPTTAAQPAAQHLHATVAGGGQKKKKKHKRRRKEQFAPVDDTVAVQADAPAAVPPAEEAALPPYSAPSAASPSGKHMAFSAAMGVKKCKGGGSMLQQMRQRLQGGRFRWLNERLYTSDGSTALKMMRQQPELMDQYHEGFREQTKGWPVQPVDQAIRWLKGLPADWAVADLGCGDAKIAATVAQRVHSFDLTSTAPGVIACNMANVPLPDGSVDGAIFCLSLMGTDYGDFLREAARILKPAGWLWIAEVQSRFVDSSGRSVLPAFLAALAALRFKVKRKDTSNSHFLVLELQRQQQKGSGSSSGSQLQQQELELEWPELRACQYKKR